MGDTENTQGMIDDPNRTQLGSPPVADPNKTVMGTAPTINATQTIKPVQCPVCKSHNPPGVMFCVECGLIFDRALPEDAFGAPVVQLPCLIDNAGREHTLRPGTNVIGRQGDVFIEDSRVSRRHAQVIFDAGVLILEDLGSTNGTLLNTVKLSDGEKLEIKAGDKISLGGYELALSLPGESAKTAMGLGGRTAQLSTAPSIEVATAWLVSEEQEFPLQEGVNSVGRKPENSLQIVDPYISGKHCEIEVLEEGIFLTDLDSTNGTFINDAKLGGGQRTEIKPKDIIKLGHTEFRLKLAHTENS